MRIINAVVWHYSWSDDVSVKTIDGWHKARGWKGIGYHGVIRKDGSFEPGRPEGDVGAHVENFNRNTLGYCLTGGKGTPWYPTDAQYATAARIAREKMAQYGITLHAATKFHRDYPGHTTSSCPGPLDRERLRREIQSTLIEEEDDMMMTSLQGDVGELREWATAGLVLESRKAVLYVDVINAGKEPASVRIVLQRQNGDYGDQTIIVPASKPGTAGFTALSIGELFNNPNAGNISLRFQATKPVTVKVTQVMGG